MSEAFSKGAPFFIRAAGARLECRRWVGERNPRMLLVLLHEGLGCVSAWRDFPRRLCAKSGCSVLAFSRLGYGQSDPVALPRPPTYMHCEALTRLPAVLAQMSYERCILLGHSDGASIALLNAGGSPVQGLAGLFLIAPHVFVEQVTLEGISAAARAYRETDLRERLARHHGARVDGAFWGWNQIWLSKGFANWNIEAYLPAIRVPVALLQGANDPYGSEAQLRAIEGGCTVRVESRLVPGCGHAPHREATDLCLEHCSAFVASLWRGRGPGVGERPPRGPPA